ncbi:Beta-lactamase-like protein [Caballeronia arationis]|jgi:glyoxylase-like metal-dependent hydrolase (beta-lactamase superfamily II)|uniref:Glyoxylase, beta-lactamase superfamily II n=1 Tax=Caballeronia arationis TaxID=1777142 RepID=A0A7Z7IBY5_9BURK|nr:MBL fold metallo-hydrolase [Caballeronia arationis]SAK88521.1 Beta-lactamase-like protein [Caballeronia arationis]SOE82938.1 Glyoxylase, beta-lactamase superfamily II [Caballeronia arationis]
MIGFPASMRVFERGWLSSNNVLFVDDERAAIVDTGYATHAPQTRALVEQVLGARRLDLIVNTHLHSDHCGGNALLQATYQCDTLIPASEAEAVRNWDEEALTFRATGQACERFGFTGTIAPGDTVRLSGLDWSVLGAPGHDPHSLMLYCAQERILISADALWENGFGVIFPELEGESGFAEQRGALDLIATLDVRAVIPGHGAPFSDVSRALETASSRLDYLVADPARNAKNALKVLIVFKLMETRSMSFDALSNLCESARAMRCAADMLVAADRRHALLAQCVDELARNGAVRVEDGILFAR